MQSAESPRDIRRVTDNILWFQVSSKQAHREQKKSTIVYFTCNLKGLHASGACAWQSLSSFYFHDKPKGTKVQKSSVTCLVGGGGRNQAACRLLSLTPKERLTRALCLPLRSHPTECGEGPRCQVAKEPEALRTTETYY